MPLLFSYGTLQQESVQLSTFGRLVQGQKDELPGFEQSLARIEDPQLVATSGNTHHANATFNGREDSRVSGTAFEITDAELAAADQMMSALATTAPGTAEMIGAQAGAWVVRSQAYTQQALAEMMRLRAIELAGQGAQLKEAARLARESRNKLTQMNR